MVKKGFIDRLYEAASMQRWNDHVRPVEFTELDKQAHKMVISYVIAKLEEDAGAKVDWINLIEGGVFELMQRVVLTDIKPPIYHKMMQERRREVNTYVFTELQDVITAIGQGFAGRFRSYFDDVEFSAREKKILRAAHYLATQWEFRIIYNTAPFIYGVKETQKEIERRLEDHFDLGGVRDIMLRQNYYNFIDLCGQLRFQQRWAQSPRIPKTSVLGHMLIVAVLSYAFSLEMGAGRKRTYNNFFSGLFHDLPEVLTRDIVSPVKRGIEGIDEVIKDYEGVQVREKILPLLPPGWHSEMEYFTTDEFQNRTLMDGEVRRGISPEDLHEKYGSDHFCPVDGQLIRACDELAAFVEASKSIEHGIISPHLKHGKEYLYQRYRNTKILGIDLGQIFDYFG